MNIFLLFAPKFLQWPLAIARELRRRDPEMSPSFTAKMAAAPTRTPRMKGS